MLSAGAEFHEERKAASYAKGGWKVGRRDQANRAATAQPLSACVDFS